MRTRHGRPPQRFAVRPFPWVLIFIVMGFVLSSQRPGLFFFFVLPLVFFFLVMRGFAMIVSFFFRSMSGPREIETYWSERLATPEPEDELNELEPPERPEARESGFPTPPPDSVKENSRLLELWERSIELAREPAFQGPCRSLLRQTHALADLYQSFRRLISAKLSPGELTYQRFLSSGTQGYEMIASELEEAASRLVQLREVGITLRPTADDIAFSPETIHQIQNEQMTKINRLLSGTQEAVAQMARVNLSIAEMRGASRGRKEGDITQAIGELKDLAQRAKQF